MYNDSFDRFATPIENRSTRQEMIELYSRNGFDGVRVSDRAAYWKTIGTKR
jgi:Spy/CpxP family protein refolding chaperone